MDENKTSSKPNTILTWPQLIHTKSARRERHDPSKVTESSSIFDGATHNVASSSFQCNALATCLIVEYDFSYIQKDHACVTSMHMNQDRKLHFHHQTARSP